jgi:hypothetical protein
VTGQHPKFRGQVAARSGGSRSSQSRNAAPGALVLSAVFEHHELPTKRRADTVRIWRRAFLAASPIAMVIAIGAVALIAILAPRTPACNGVLQGFGPGDWPSGCWRPYGDLSPFNQVLPPSPRLVANSDAIVANLTASGGPDSIIQGVTGTSSDWGHPTYYSTTSDPTFTVHCTRQWGTCPVEGMTIHIPGQAQPASGGDGHLTVVDQAGGWEYDFWQVQSNPVSKATGGVLNISWGGRTRIGTPDATGLGSAATASHFSNLAGIIRPQELAAGQINHALFIIAKCDNGQYVYPAEALGLKCSDPTNAPSEGTRFQLTLTDAQIKALNAPAWKTAILTAMAHYGFYVGDTGGSPWDVQVESGATETSFGHANPWTQLANANGIPSYSGRYYFDFSQGVDWRNDLRVIDPCVTKRTC